LHCSSSCSTVFLSFKLGFRIQLFRTLSRRHCIYSAASCGTVMYSAKQILVWFLELQFLRMMYHSIWLSVSFLCHKFRRGSACPFRAGFHSLSSLLIRIAMCLRRHFFVSFLSSSSYTVIPGLLIIIVWSVVAILVCPSIAFVVCFGDV